MPIAKQKITPCLWFDTRAEEAAKFYVSVFKNGRIRNVSRFPDAGKEIHGKDAGSVMVVEFEIEGQTFTALNGGPQFTFDEAVSFQVMCDTQDEIDAYWFKLSWQIVPSIVPEMMTSGGPEKAARVMNAFMKMKKLDIAAIKRAYDGI